MSSPIRSLSLAALLALGAGLSAFAPAPSAPAPTTLRAPRASYADYLNGYTAGKSETEQNKCIDQGRFYENYSRYYRPRAEANRNFAATPDEYDYWTGYLDGMDEGYNSPVYCAPPGGGGTGGGGTGGGNAPDFPEIP